MLAIARYGCALRRGRTPLERAARSRPKNSHPLSTAVLHADETLIALLDPGNGKTRKA